MPVGSYTPHAAHSSPSAIMPVLELIFQFIGPNQACMRKTSEDCGQQNGNGTATSRSSASGKDSLKNASKGENPERKAQKKVSQVRVRRSCHTWRAVLLGPY